MYYLGDEHLIEKAQDKLLESLMCLREVQFQRFNTPDKLREEHGKHAEAELTYDSASEQPTWGWEEPTVDEVKEALAHSNRADSEADRKYWNRWKVRGDDTDFRGIIYETLFYALDKVKNVEDLDEMAIDVLAQCEGPTDHQDKLVAALKNLQALRDLVGCRGHTDAPTKRLDHHTGVGRGRIDLN